MAASDQPLGLAHTEAVVRAHDPRWARAYKEAEARLDAVLGPLAAGIEHIGSTAVPGLAAKPVLDVGIAFTSRRKLDEAARRLGEDGWEWLCDAGDEGGVILVLGPESVRTHILHLVELDDHQWRRYLVFRDALRRDPALRERYAALKTGLAEQFPTDRPAYASGKERFIRETLADLQNAPSP